MTKYEITPIDGRKSFYGKAYIIALPETVTLYSYNTPILEKDVKSGKLTRLWDGWSTTSGRHISAFCGLNKKEFLSLPIKSA